jgi:hypothetical protein
VGAPGLRVVVQRLPDGDSDGENHRERDEKEEPPRAVRSAAARARPS